MTKLKITIVTATFNSARLLPRLVNSLLAQTDQDFEWVVADGGSNDGTLALLEHAKLALGNVYVDSREDFGIYDALNRGVKLAHGDYYLVAGADDEFYPNAVADYRAACAASGADLVTARIESNGNIQGPRKHCWPWLYGQFAFVSSHAIGVAIRRSLHSDHGLYSNKLPIAADQLFLLTCIKNGSTVSAHPFVAGRFENTSGTSGQDTLGVLLEGFRVQVIMGHSLWIQGIVFGLRILKNWRKIWKRK